MSLECVKTEPEWDDEYGVSEAAACANLYKGHRVEDELVIGPELLQPRDIAFTIGVAPDESWTKICKQELTQEQRHMTTCELETALDSRDSPQLRDCFVVLERITLDKVTLFHYKSAFPRPTEEDELQKNNQNNGDEEKVKKNYVCDHCSKQFSDRKSMIRHIRKHTKGKMYICDNCSKRFSDRKSFIIHIRIHTGLKPYTCDICKKKFACIKYLARHKFIHKDRLFACDICEKKFSFKSALITHKLVHTEGKRFSCDICSKKLASQNSLDRHKLIHTGEKPFSCDICEKQYRHKSSLVTHKRMHAQETYECVQRIESHQNLYDNKQQRQYTGNKSHRGNQRETCDICKKQFYYWYLNSHKRSHTKPFQCEVCQKKFSEKRNLLSHYAVHTGVKAISCNICKMQFTTRARLTNHKLTHMLPFSCEICKKQFKRKDSFVNHKLIHAGEKPFACEICKKQFRLKFSLKSHLRTHDKSDDKRKLFKLRNLKDFPQENLYKLSCEICGYKCTTTTRLSIHKRKHTGEKLFTCDVCEKRFRQKQCNLSHENTHRRGALWL